MPEEKKKTGVFGKIRKWLGRGIREREAWEAGQERARRAAGGDASKERVKQWIIDNPDKAYPRRPRRHRPPNARRRNRPAGSGR